MSSKLTKVVNYEDSLLNAKTTITGVNLAYLQRRGDYELVIFKLNPHYKQKLHYHTYGDIDIFTVVEGSGYLNYQLPSVKNHLGKHHHDMK